MRDVTSTRDVRGARRSRAEPRRGAPRRGGDAGFTLVEVLVALTAGLVVSAAAYMLARNAMKSFQDESRIATGQVGVALGMSRLTADLQRAGYMSSPNIASDPRRCPSVTASTVPLAAIRVREAGSAEDSVVSDAGYDLEDNAGVAPPDMIVIAGNMTSSEQFEYRGITSGVMHLAVNRGPTQRAYQDVGMDAAAFCEIFIPPARAGEDAVAPSRFARLVEPSGKESYVLVTGCDAEDDTSGNLVSVALDIVDPATGTPPSLTGNTCGARPGGGLVNPVSIIRYRLAQVCDPYAVSCSEPGYLPVLRNTGPNEVTGEASRLELIREEIAPDSAAEPFDLGADVLAWEMVTELAVGLDVALVVADDDVDLNQPSKLAFIPFGDAAMDTALPQRVRSVRVRLSTRARVPDRDAPSPPGGVATRFLLPGVLANNRYARLRTLVSDVSLPNLQQVTW